MITAENITDEQIRELRTVSWLFGDMKTFNACRSALRKQNRTGPNLHRRDARARCAEILNARAKESR